MASWTNTYYFTVLNIVILGSLVGCDDAKHRQEQERQASLEKQMEAKKAKVQAQIDANIAAREHKEAIKKQEIENGVGIKDWSWEPKTTFAGERISDGDVISINFTITNNTPHKLIHATFDVYLWDERNRSILKDDTKATFLAKKLVTCFTDAGYDFCPSNHIRKDDIMIPIKKYSSPSVKSVTLTLLSVDTAEMTDIDARLTKLGDYIDSQKSQGNDVPDQSYVVQARMLLEKKQQNKSR